MGKKLKWNLIVMSVLYLALGIFLLMVPGTALNVVCYALGGVVLLGAVIQLVRYFLVERGIFQSQLTLISGLVCLALGGFLILRSDIVVRILPIVFGLFVIFDSLGRVQNALELRRCGYGSWKGFLLLALLSVVLGVTFRQEHALAHSTSFQNLEVILMIVYVSVILAIAVLCFVNTIQRFYQNLLGREGYLMHTLPVNENQLILSKLLTSMVWVLCSGLVGIVCITVMVSIGVIDSETFGMVDWNSWKQLWQMLYEEIGPEFWVAMAWTILINLARLASLILCVYAACMIAHQFPKHVMVAGILAFIGLNIVETQLDKLLGTNDVSMIVDVTYRVVGVNVTGVSYGVTPMRWLTAALGTDVGYLFCFAVTAAIAAAYFFLTRWLMKNKLNLE
mgnify:CR=1 FL=1